MKKYILFSQGIFEQDKIQFVFLFAENGVLSAKKAFLLNFWGLIVEQSLIGIFPDIIINFSTIKKFITAN
jgi:hypothetical protein